MASMKSEEQDAISACAKVFGTAELADQILLDLPLRDLLCGAQQVSRQWKDAVETSNLVQEHLFMKPICDKRVYAYMSAVILQWWTRDEHWHIPRMVLENPFLILLSHEKVCLQDEAFTRPGASWRKMLITQPPVGEAHCNEWKWVTTSDGKGVTLGDISDGLPSRTLARIDSWSAWMSYKGPQQLKEAKIAMRLNIRPVEEDIEDECDDLWWMPDEYLCGI
ncbi:hypothetical protein M409DRAFT_21090 [Zasmidium cellare ATCC 36951]|uniref:F-box domain-containing protein n=1 Tax=Zasmidium cellare ATCC 36951 TaxID=1080233 RepID=A0A6A6CTH7_ZASCE|nr:uncharacterized protein M409DRAFT_21090 [Zasmidium cellare ATCC 36951]KAF2169079.1 hypothetical protein M409DRAFT_21090 [Zasmidium cellare ATCC 36951]